MKLRVFIMTLLLSSFSGMIFAQAYLPELEKGNIDLVIKKLDLLGSSISKEPVMALYLSSSNPNAEIVKQLFDKGADPNQVHPINKLSPICIAVKNGCDAKITSMLLEKSALLTIPFKGSWGASVIDYAFYTKDYETASILIKYNNKLISAKRVVIDSKYADRIAILSDDLAKAKVIISAGSIQENEIWKIAIIGECREILNLLVALNNSPALDKNTLIIMALKSELFKYLISNDLKLDDTSFDFENIYTKIIEQKNFESFSILRLYDTQKRSKMYDLSFVNGIEWLKTISRDFTDFDRQDLYDTGFIYSLYDNGEVVTVDSLLKKMPPSSKNIVSIFDNRPNMFEYLLNETYEKSSFISNLSNDETYLDSLYSKLIRQNNLTLLSRVRAIDSLKRPDYYDLALTKGVSWLKMISRDFTDFERKDLYDKGYLYPIYEEGLLNDVESLVSKYIPSSKDIVTIYSKNPVLMISIANFKNTKPSTFSDLGSSERELFWKKVIEKNKLDEIIALYKLDSPSPDIALLHIINTNPELVGTLLEQGVKIKSTQTAWDRVIKSDNLELYKIFLSFGNVPGDIFRKCMQVGDASTFTLLSSGYSPSKEEISWKYIIEKNYTKTIDWLIKNGFVPNADLVLQSLSVSEEMFVKMAGKSGVITKDTLGKTVTDYDIPGYGRTTKRLILEIAIDNGFMKSIKFLAENFNIFDPENNSEMQDIASLVLQKRQYENRSRANFKYYAVIVGHTADNSKDDYLFGEKSERGYGHDGYNDFLTNNFNTLCFLIAVKYDQIEIAKYILRFDPSVAKKNVFSGNEIEGPGIYKYSVKDFIKAKYPSSSILQSLK